VSTCWFPGHLLCHLLATVASLSVRAGCSVPATTSSGLEFTIVDAVKSLQVLFLSSNSAEAHSLLHSFADAKESTN
jgi:hypothetical protein